MATGEEAKMPFTEEKGLSWATCMLIYESKLAKVIAGIQDTREFLDELVEEIGRDAEDGGWRSEFEVLVDAKRAEMREFLEELVEGAGPDAEDGGRYPDLQALAGARRSGMCAAPSTAAERMHALACPSACPSISESMPGYLALIEEEARLGATSTSFKCWLRGDGAGEDTCAMLSGAAAAELAKALRAEGFEAHATGMPMLDRCPFWRVDVAW